MISVLSVAEHSSVDLIAVVLAVCHEPAWKFVAVIAFKPQLHIRTKLQ